MGQAAIAIACFVAGFIFRHCWPLLVAWQEQRNFVKYKAGLTIEQVEKAMTDPSSTQTFIPKPNIPRRVGLAENRARKEHESMIPAEHQAQVTQKNIAAMEGK